MFKAESFPAHRNTDINSRQSSATIMQIKIELLARPLIPLYL